MRCLKHFNIDYFYLTILLALLFGLPLGIDAYDRSLEPRDLPQGAKSFTLVGNAQKGWLLGEVQAYRMISLWNRPDTKRDPIIEVEQGDMVVLKLRSSDVTHGFSLKAYGIYIPDGILPGKTVYVSFRADRAGTFIFACNVFCGDIHQNMQGKLIVR